MQDRSLVLRVIAHFLNEDSPIDDEPKSAVSRLSELADMLEDLLLALEQDDASHRARLQDIVRSLEHSPTIGMIPFLRRLAGLLRESQIA